MTTMTCQRNRIVSFAGIVPIRRYILLRSGFFPEDSRKTHGVWKRPGQHHARPFADGRKKRLKTTSRPRRWSCEGALLIFCHLLGFTTSHRVSTLPGTYQHVTLVYPGQPARQSVPYLFVEEDTKRMLPGYRGKVEASRSMKLILSKRTEIFHL